MRFSTRQLLLLSGTAGMWLLLTGSVLVARVCTGHLILHTQAQIDACDCSSVTGDVVISGPGIVDVDGLDELYRIEGALLIENNPLLTDVDGLYHLRHIGKWLFVTGNASLQHLDGLSQVGYVGASIDLRFNPTLAQIDGLHGLQYVPGRVWIRENDALQNLDGLRSVQTIGGFLGIDDNDALTDIDGLASLFYVAGEVAIEHNPLLEQVDGLGRLSAVGRWLFLLDNAKLQNLDGLKQVRRVGDRVWIADNPLLDACCGLAPLLRNGSIGGSIDIYNNSGHCTPAWIGLCPLPLAHQSWQNIGPLSGPVLDLTSDGAMLYAASYFGTFRSADEGTTWHLWYRNSPHQLYVCDNAPLHSPSLARLGDEVAGLQFSWGDGWPTIGNPVEEDGSIVSPLYDLLGVGSYLYVAANDQVYRSSDRGATWSGSGVLIPHPVYPWHNGIQLVRLFASGSDLWVASEQGHVLHSQDQGQTWTPDVRGQLPGAPAAFAVRHNRLYAAVPGHGVWLSQGGTPWVAVNNGLPSLDVRGLTVYQDWLYAGLAGEGVFFSTNHGGQWTPSGLEGQAIHTLFSDGQQLWAGGANGAFVKATGAQTWFSRSRGLATADITSLAAKNKRLIAGSYLHDEYGGEDDYEGIYFRGSLPGIDWTRYCDPGFYSVSRIQQQGDTVLIIQTEQLFDAGSKLDVWSLSGGKLDYTIQGYTGEQIATAAIQGNMLYFADRLPPPSFGFHVSADRGYTYQLPGGPGAVINSLYIRGGLLVAATENGVYRSIDQGQSWQAWGLQGSNVHSLTWGNDFVLARVANWRVSAFGTGVHQPVDLYRCMLDIPGSVWQSLGVTLQTGEIVWAKRVLYGATPQGVHYSPDAGDTWLPLAPNDVGEPYNYLTASHLNALVAADNDFLYLGSQDHGVWRHPLIDLPPNVREAAPDAAVVRIYPNPADDKFLLEAPGKGTVRLYSLDGRPVWQRDYEGPYMVCTVADLAAGVYLLHLETGTARHVLRLIKQ